MSVKVMGQVWELDLPHQEVLVLLAMADHADHEGRHVHPSLGLLSWKTNYSKRQIIRIMQALEAKRLIRVRKSGGGRGRVTEYTLLLENGVRKTPFRKDDNLTPFSDEAPVSEPLGNANGDRRNGDMASPFALNSDMASPFSKDTPSHQASETVTFVTQNSDIAMSPKPSLEPKPKTKKEPPPSLTLPPEGGMEEGDVTAASFNRPAQLQTKEVLTHLITVSGIQYKTAGLITRRLAGGATVADCTLVIDWWAYAWSVKRPDQRDLLDPTTPFKPGKFQEYLAKARQWHEQGRLVPGATGSQVSAKGLRNLAVTQQLLKEDGIL
jgi:uncharacterized phage protein (TIGR02220 family)